MEQERPVRKGLHKEFHISRLDSYISFGIAIVFVIIGAVKLFNIADIEFISVIDSFQFVLLLGIFGMISRMYYKFFEEKYDKK